MVLPIVSANLVAEIMESMVKPIVSIICMISRTMFWTLRELSDAIVPEIMEIMETICKAWKLLVKAIISTYGDYWLDYW